MGIPVFPPRFETDLLRPFYDGLERGELRLSACSECGAWHWYPPELLPCHPEAALDWRPVSPEGTVYMFTTVQRSLLPGDHSGEVPFTVLFVESDDVPGARVPALFDNPDGREPACGMRVRLSPVQAGDRVVAGFRPM